MKFYRVIGKIDENIVNQARKKLSDCFLELGTKYDIKLMFSQLGGDPLIFSLVYPSKHICTANIPTAGTDGKYYYWNPHFILRLSAIGLRLVVVHEAVHDFYQHPSRRGSRNPKLWNIAVDYIVHSIVFDDLVNRKQDANKVFQDNLGKFITLEQLKQLYKDPFTKIPGLERLSPSDADDVKLPLPDEDRELTEEEKKAIEKKSKRSTYFYADGSIPVDMRRPEKIYDILYALLPKCPECGKLGIYQKPKNDKSKGKKDKGGSGGKDKDPKDKGDKNQNDQGSGNGQGDKCDHDHGCGTCGSGVDIFGFGSTLDDHMDVKESQEKIAKKMAEAMENAKKMAGTIPAAFEDELGKLTDPKIKWQDAVRSKIVRTRAGNTKNDWTKFRSRQMFMGILAPKKRGNFSNFIALLDTSGSMGKDDMSYGISQLAVLDDKAEGFVVPADAQIYWEAATKIRKADKENLAKVKVVGRGGTMFSDFFTNYQQKIGPADFLIVITDGYLLDQDIANMQDPGIDVFWIITSECDFKAPFGKVYKLRND